MPDELPVDRHPQETMISILATNASERYDQTYEQSSRKGGWDGDGGKKSQNYVKKRLRNNLAEDD